MATEQYRAVNNTIRAEMKKSKKDWISKQCDIIEEGLTICDSKKAYDTLKKLTKPQQQKATNIEDKSDRLLTEESAILKRWICTTTSLSQINRSSTTANPDNQKTMKAARSYQGRSRKLSAP